MARWTASAKWGEAPALAVQRAMPLALRLSEGLGVTFALQASGVSTSRRYLPSEKLMR